MLTRAALRAAPVPAFYMYGEREGELALDQSWLRSCPTFEGLQTRSIREQLAEVFLYDLLRHHPSRTRHPESATLFFVPIWIKVSQHVGSCNGTTNRERMSHAGAALKDSPIFRSRHGQPAGFDHVIATTYFGEPNAGVLVKTLVWQAPLMHFIVGHDIAGDVHGYEGFRGRALGRCAIEVPYVANQFAAAARRPPHVERKRLLHFRGSLRVCCREHAQGPEIREAIARLQNASMCCRRGAAHQQDNNRSSAHDSVLIVAVARAEHSQSTSSQSSRAAPSREAVSHSDNEERLARGHLKGAGGFVAPTEPASAREFAAMGREMGDSDFCLVPAGDSSVTSRLYSAIAAGCIPVVISPGLSGAFASHVPYEHLWLRVSAAAFIHRPHDLLRRLREVSLAERRRRRHQLSIYAADVLYDAPSR